MQILPFIAAAGVAMVATWAIDKISKNVTGKTVGENLDTGYTKVLYLVTPETKPESESGPTDISKPS